MYQRNRNIVGRPDGKQVNVARARGQLFVCSSGCCCGRTEDGFAPVPVDLYHEEWERRRLRNIVHLTIGGCLGPCALANVVMLLFDGQSHFFQSVNSAATVYALYDYIEQMLDADQLLPPPPALAPLRFTGMTWQPRPDGQPVDDHRHWPARRAARAKAEAQLACAAPDESAADRLVANMDGESALPRKNGELVFTEPWQGRAFGMAVSLHEQAVYDWDEFRRRLVARIAAGDRAAAGADIAGRADDPATYYEQWLAAFEGVLIDRGVVSTAEIEERTAEFEFGERDDVF